MPELLWLTVKFPGFTPVKFTLAPPYKNSLQLGPYILYECIISVKWPDRDIFNFAAMGIRFTDEFAAFINPYPGSDTYSLLKMYLKNGIKPIITVNFTDNPILFAKAALYGYGKGPDRQELDDSEFIPNGEAAVIKSADRVIIARVRSEVPPDIPLDFSGEFSDFNRRRVKTKFKAGFMIEPVERYMGKIYAGPFTRGRNLAVEAIVYASKLPYFLKKNAAEEISVNRITLLIERIRFNIGEVRRFSADRDALKACNMVEEYMKRLLDI